MIIYYFTSQTIRRDQEVAIDDLITWLVTWERDTGTAVLDGNERRIAHDLRHAHLPKLAGAGLIEYDSDRRMIRYRGSPLFEDVIHIEQLMTRELGGGTFDR